MYPVVGSTGFTNVGAMFDTTVGLGPSPLLPFFFTFHCLAKPICEATATDVARSVVLSGEPCKTGSTDPDAFLCGGGGQTQVGRRNHYYMGECTMAPPGEYVGMIC